MTIKTYQIKVGGITVDVVRKNIKNLHLSVNPPAGRVRIAAPHRLNDEAVRVFGVSRLAWIKKQQAKFRNQARETKREYLDGESHYYLGKRYLLNVIQENKPPRVELKGKSKINLYVRPNSSIQKKEDTLNNWYRSSLEEVAHKLIMKWEKKIGRDVKELSIRKMRTRWGTCKREQQKICLNLELAKKPEHCIEYIIVHEMVHLLEQNHTDKFKAHMNKFMPKWRLYKEELNKSLLGDVKWKY